MANVFGDDDPNVLNGTEQNDFIFGGGGDDTIDGRGGADQISGDAGADTIIGGAGGDVFTDAFFLADNAEDVYVLTAAEDSLHGQGDRYEFFEFGIDKIDLSALGKDEGSQAVRTGSNLIADDRPTGFFEGADFLVLDLGLRYQVFADIDGDNALTEGVDVSFVVEDFFSPGDLPPPEDFLGSVSATPSGPRLDFDRTEFSEAGGDNGTIGNAVTVTLTGATFADQASVSAAVSFGATPNGLTADVMRLSETQIEITFGGTAANSDDADDIDTMVSFADGAFQDATASEVDGASTPITFDFADAPLQFEYVDDGDVFHDPIGGGAFYLGQQGAPRGRGDFNGDGVLDFVYEYNGGGAHILFSGSLLEDAFLGQQGDLRAIADLEDDGRDDLIFQFGGGGYQVLFDGDPSNALSLGQVGDLRSVVDLDGDDVPELVFEFKGGGEHIVRFADDNVSSDILIGNQGALVGTGDFDGDDRADLIFQFKGGGVQVLFGGDPDDASFLGEPGVLRGVADVNGDGADDLIFDNGQRGHRILFEADPTAPRYLGPQGVLSGVADVNNDGSDDLVFEYPNGQGEHILLSGDPAMDVFLGEEGTLRAIVSGFGAAGDDLLFDYPAGGDHIIIDGDRDADLFFGRFGTFSGDGSLDLVNFGSDFLVGL